MHGVVALECVLVTLVGQHVREDVLARHVECLDLTRLAVRKVHLHTYVYTPG